MALFRALLLLSATAAGVHSFCPGPSSLPSSLARPSSLSPHSPPLHSLPTAGRPKGGIRLRMAAGGDGEEQEPGGLGAGGKFRREFLRDALLLGACGCGACLLPAQADALAQIRPPPREALEAFDLPRDKFLDASFACGMFTGMGDYEQEAAPRKAKLFRELLSSLPRKDPVVAEVGIGSFPNARFFNVREAPRGMDIVGIDPNDSMSGYAYENARRAKLTGKGGKGGPNSLRIVHGVSEALPLEDASCDAVVVSLTFCSVLDPEKSIAEVKRVLKPGGKFLFWEHVLSERDPSVAKRQIALTPNQVKRADGCHLDRRTGEVIKAAGFSSVDIDSFDLTEQGFLNPTVAGIATL